MVLACEICDYLDFLDPKTAVEVTARYLQDKEEFIYNATNKVADYLGDTVGVVDNQ